MSCKNEVKYLRQCGCLAKVAIIILKKVKIDIKIIDCIFIGCLYNNSAYRFFVHKSTIPNIHKNKVIELRNASFFENIFSYKSKEGISSSKWTHELWLKIIRTEN